MLELVSVVVNPLQRLLDPIKTATPLVIKDSQRNQVRAGANALVLTVLATNDSGDMRSMESTWCVVIRIGIVFCEVIAPHDLASGSEPVSECGVVIRDPRINDSNRLATTVKAKACSDGCLLYTYDAADEA